MEYLHRDNYGRTLSFKNTYIRPPYKYWVRATLTYFVSKEHVLLF